MNIRQIFISSLRMYFAPLVGAYQAVVKEMKRMQNQHV